MPAIYGYIRVSTDAQRKYGLSLDAQRERITRWAQDRGARVDRWFIDGESARKVPLVERKEGKLLAHVVRPGDLVVATKLDRMFRSTHDAIKTISDWRAIGVGVSILDFMSGGLDLSTPQGEFIFTIFAALAAFEAELLRERIREAKREAKARGVDHRAWAYIGRQWAFKENRRTSGMKAYQVDDPYMVDQLEEIVRRMANRERAVDIAKDLKARGLVKRMSKLRATGNKKHRRYRAKWHEVPWSKYWVQKCRRDYLKWRSVEQVEKESHEVPTSGPPTGRSSVRRERISGSDHHPQGEGEGLFVGNHGTHCR
jgi:DNA invertase Pin-like site-specific DNA recombinase